MPRLLPEATSQAPFREYAYIAASVLLMLAAPCAALDLSPPPAQRAPAVEAAPTQLPDVNVFGQRNAFQDADRKLKALIERSAPCLGCDAVKPEIPPSVAAQALGQAVYLLTPQESQPIDTDDTLANELDRANFEQRLPSNRNP